MDGYVGRRKELEFLEDLWNKVPVACAISGRHHLGKTSLLKKFTSDKRFIYITGTPGLRTDNLKEINLALSKFSGKNEEIDDISNLFPKLKRLCGKEKTVVIIDCVTDLTQNFEEINAYIRNFVNKEMNNTRIMLIVCESDSSVFGRFYYTLDLKPMKYLDCKGFHPKYTPYQHFLSYSLVGGTPAYQKLFRDRDPEEIIKTEMFDHMSVFSLEATSMVKSDLASYNECVKILSALADGAENVREISNRSGLPLTFVNKVIEDLVDKGLVVKEVSSGLSKRAVYTISSNILKFYYEVVNKYTHMVEFESSADAYETAKDQIAAYMEKSFKAVCMEYVATNFEYSFVGKLRKKDDTVDNVIDFLASVSQKSSDKVLTARCRLYGNPIGVEELDELVERSKVVSGNNKLYILFSGTGFTEELKKHSASRNDVKLLTLEQVYGE